MLKEDHPWLSTPRFRPTTSQATLLAFTTFTKKLLPSESLQYDHVLDCSKLAET